MAIFLETIKESRIVKGLGCYSVFTFEPLYVLHFRISKMMKECTVSYLSSDRLRTRGEQNGEDVDHENTFAATPRVQSAAKGYQN